MDSDVVVELVVALGELELAPLEEQWEAPLLDWAREILGWLDAKVVKARCLGAHLEGATWDAPLESALVAPLEEQE